MATIRAKLTVAYAGALLGSVAVYSVALFGERRANARREIGREVAVQADLALRVLRFAATANEPVTTSTSQVIGAGTQQFVQTSAQITPRIAAILDGLPDYVVLMDSIGKALYVSPSVRLLQSRDPTSGDYDRLMREAVSLAPGRQVFPVPVGNSSVLLVALAETDSSTRVTRVVAGREVDLTADWVREFLATILVVAPLIIGASVGAAYLIAGRAVEPVGRMINEVEAISDGRSLHRRLPVETTGDELARLGATLNAMIARLETSFAALRRFTADASHELKTPLAVLRADVERAMHSSPTST
jgi:two-component system OmpR family sensor kinase